MLEKVGVLKAIYKTSALNKSKYSFINIFACVLDSVKYWNQIVVTQLAKYRNMLM